MTQTLPKRVVEMPSEQDESRRTLIIVVAIVAAILVVGFFALLMRSTAGPPGPPPRLEAAIREGSPEFEQYRSRIVFDEPVADDATTVLAGLQMFLRATAHNFTGKTITGLEVRGAVLDHNGKPVKERVVVVIPGRQSELEPNKSMVVPVKLEGLKDTDDRAKVVMEVTAFKFK